jgi:hypothetical protein
MTGHPFAVADMKEEAADDADKGEENAQVDEDADDEDTGNEEASEVEDDDEEAEEEDGKGVRTTSLF